MNEHLVTVLQAFQNTPTAELEVIISRKVMQGKQNGTLPFEMWKKLYRWVKTGCKQNPIHMIFEGEQEFMDCFYDNNVRVRARFGQDPVCIIKTKIASIHAKCPQRKFLDFHFTLKNEVPTTEPAIGQQPLYVRIQKVYSFRYKNAFQYVFKKVATGATKELACQETPTYELELEVLRDSHYFQTKTIEHIADSFIEKTLDLTGRGENEELTLELSILPKSLKLVEAKIKGPTRKYISKKKLLAMGADVNIQKPPKKPKKEPKQKKKILVE